MARRAFKIVGAMLLFGALATACSSTPANDFEEGECTNDDLTGTVGDIDTVDCDDEHLYEAIGTFDIDGDDYPGDDEVQQEALETCTGDIFEEYVGIAYSESEIYAQHPLTPSQQSWDDADDRTVICLAYDVDDPTGPNPQPVTSEGSVEGAER